MENCVKDKITILKNILLILVGILGLWILVDSVINFSYPDFLYENDPELDFFIGINVVSGWANFSFFTFHTLILFSFYCIFRGLSYFFNWKTIDAFLKKDTVACFVFLNYLVTVFLYTSFQFFAGDLTFGLYALKPLAFHNFGTNILVHYVFFVIELFIFIKTKTAKGNARKSIILIVSYLIVYYTVVKITGEICYDIKWFPYTIFDAKSFGAIFGISNYALCVAFLCIFIILFLICYIALYLLFIKLKNKKSVTDCAKVR